MNVSIGKAGNSGLWRCSEYEILLYVFVGAYAAMG